MRKVKLEDIKLKMILEERAELFEQLNAVNKILVEEDKNRKKIGYKMERLKAKTKKIIDKSKIEVSEFEEITNVGIEDREVVITIVDQIEEYKKLLIDKKNGNK